MRSTTAGELTTLSGLNRQVTWRVKIANGSGTMVDLSSWVEHVNRNEDVDQPVAGATIELTRANGVLQTLSPLRTDSTLNRLDDGVTYGPLIDLVRAVTIEVATTPSGVLPGSADFKLKFKGTTSTVDFSQNPIVVDCRDEGGQLVDRWVETKKLYGSGPGVALETVMQSIHDDVFGAGVIPVWTPVSPSYLISPAYQQQYESVMDADVALAQNPGWDVRYRWDDGTAAFRFKLYGPDRTKTVPDYTFGPKDYFDVTKLELSELDVRNVVIVDYPSGGGNRDVISVSDGPSITKYRRRPLLITEGDASPINTSGEATTMANAALADLKDPRAEFEIVLPFFWPGELGDLYRFSANGVHFDTNQDWAVVTITDDLSPGRHETRIKVRGKPAGQYLAWLARGGVIGGGGGSGAVAKPPVAIIFPLNTELTDAHWDLQFSAKIGSGGGGTNLTYTIKSKSTFGTESLLDSGNASALPKTLSITRNPTQDQVITFTVTDAATTLSASAVFTVPASHPANDPATGAPKRAAPFDDGKYATRANDAGGGVVDTGVTEIGGKLISRMFAKPLPADPDTLDSVPDGVTNGKILNTRINLGRPVIDFTESIHTGKTLANIPDSASRFAAIQANADHTASNTSADTAAVNGVSATTVQTGSAKAHSVIDTGLNISVKGSGSTPGIAALAGIGVGGTLAISGTDSSGLITLTSGTGTMNAGDLLRITFASAKAAAPVGIIQLNATGGDYKRITAYAFTTTTWDIYFWDTPLASPFVYYINYIVFNLT